VDIALGDLSTSLSGVADNEFKRIQIDAATKAGKKTFDSEAFMKKERIAFLSCDLYSDIHCELEKQNKVAQIANLDV